VIRKYEDGLTRCQWPGNDELYIHYHDTEWGVPQTGAIRRSIADGEVNL
jgi:DNA-3-methyladenine glycosylase I